MRSKMLFMLLLVITVTIFQSCSKKPGSVIKDFYDAKTWEEKKAFILDADGLKYSNVFDEDAIYEVKDISLSKKINDTCSVYKFTRIKTKGGNEDKKVIKFLIINSGGVEKIDIKTSLCRNEMTFDQYIDKQPLKPVKFWVTPSHSVYGQLYEKYYGKLTEIRCENSSTCFFVILSQKDSLEGKEKIYEIGLRNEDKPVLIEISKLTKGWSDHYIIDGGKLIQEWPCQD